MRSRVLQILFFLLLMQANLIGLKLYADPVCHSTNSTPTITGPDTTCAGVSGYIYYTEAGKENYEWTISPGGTIDLGAETNSVTVTWNTPGPQTISVIYSPETTPAVLNVTVLSPVVVGITISASANPVCEGALVTYTATTANGGSAPVYQWRVDGVEAGANSPVFSYSPTNGDIITCQLTSSLICTTGSTVTSDPITMTVNPNLPVSISISASSNPSCSGNVVNFTAIALNGGSAPFYQWKVNGANVGTNNAIYSYIPNNGEIVTCVLTSNETCKSGNPATSNNITMTVSPLQPVSVSIAASANPACLGSLVTFTATPVNGGSSPVYEWKVNGIIVGNGPTYTYVPVNGNTITCKLTSNAGCTTGNPAISNEIIIIVIPYSPVSISIAASANPVCAGIPVTFTATPMNGGPSPVYQWEINGFPVGTNNSVYTYFPANGDIVTCQLTSSLPCASGNPANSNPVTMIVNPALPPSVSITASANPACQGTLVQFTATALNGGSSPVYQWKVDGVNVGTNSPTYTFTPVNGNIVTCQMTSSDPCTLGNVVTSNAINMMVSPGLAVSIIITASSNPSCIGSTVTFTSAIMNGGSTPVYDWMVNGVPVGIHTASYTYSPTNGNIVTCQLTSSLSCATGNPAISNAITMVVSSGLPVSITIAASSNPSCQGQTVTYNATTVNGGTNPTYQWMVNGVNMGSNLPVLSYNPSNGDSVICYLISTYPCATGNPATSNKIFMTVNPNLTVSILITSSPNPSCQGSQVTYTATAVNGGSNPVYQWKVNGLNVGSNQPAFTFVPSNGNIITCQLTSSAPCPISNPVTSNAITQTVYPIVPAGITISPSGNPVCTGTQVTFTATATNGGSDPIYQWKINGVNAGTNSSVLIFYPANGDVITCKLTSSLMCVSGNPVTSSAITMIVSSSLPANATISASSNPFCQGASVTFSAAAINGGSNPVYQWQVNGVNHGTNSASYAYAPVNGDYVTCSVTSSLWCATPNPVTSNPIFMQLNTNTPAGVSITASANPVCQGNPVIFTAVPVNGGSAPVYQWKLNGINVGTNNITYTCTPVNGDIITCMLTSNAPCVSGSPVTSNPVVMVVSTALPASVSISTQTNPFCVNDPVTFIAAAVNGGSAPFYQWKVNGVNAGTGSASFTYSPLNGDFVTCWLTSNSTCISGSNPVESNTITMISTTALPVSVSITASSNPVCQGTAVSYTATPVNGGYTPVYQWKVNGINTGPNNRVFHHTPLNGDIITCLLTSSLSCATGNPATSNPISMIVNPPQLVSITIVASSNPVCLGVMETFTATPVNGGSSPVYQWRVNGADMGTNSPVFSYIPQNGDVVTCELISNATCITGNPAISNPIAIVVGNLQTVSVTISASANPFCLGQSVTFTAHPTNGGTSPIYQWKVNSVNQGLNDSIFIYIPNPGDTISCLLTSNQACICNNPALSNKIIMVASSNLPVSISISASMNPICAGTNVVFTAIPVNGGSSPVYQWKVNGLPSGPNFYIFQFAPANGDIITCQLTSNLTCATGNPATSNPITMTVFPLLPVSVNIVASANPSCEGNTVCYTATVTNGGTDPLYRWKVNGVIVGTNSPTFCYVPLNGNVVLCRVTSNATCASGNPANSNSITMNVIPYSPVSVSISASANPICQGTIVLFTATPVNGGSSPTYQWKVNGIDAGTNSSTYSYLPVNGDVVYCNMVSNANCVLTNTATSNSITITVSPSLTVSVSIAASANPVCQGTSVTFTATPANGGTMPSYQWKVNGLNAGSNSPLFTYVPVDGDVVTCILTSNAACTQGNPATSNSITINVSASIPVSVSITASANQACQGQLICYTATPVNEGPNPVYQWMINGMNVGTNSTTYCYYPSSGDAVSCQLTSSYTCASGNPAMSNVIVLTFYPNLPVSVSITCSANPACQGTSVTYTATPINGGTSPIYQWKVNGIPAGSNLPNFTYVPVNGDIINCQLTSNVPCPVNNPATSNPITMSVLVPVSIAVSIAASANPVCVGTSVTYVATAINGGNSPVYQWQVNGLTVGANLPTYTYIPANGDIVTCQLTSSYTCVSNNPAMSNIITMVVRSDFPVSVDISASSNPACQGQFVTFTATAINGGPGSVYQWNVNGINVGINSATYIYSPTNGDLVTCTVTSSYSCASNNPATSSAINMIINPILPVSISITSSFNPACLGTTVTYTATTVNGGSSPVYQWKVNGLNVGSNLSTYTYIPVNGDIITCQVTSSSICVSGNPAISNQIVMIIGTGFPVSVSIAASGNPVCVATSVTFTATPTYGGSVPFYQWKVNGVNSGTNSTTYTYFPIDGDVITCTLTSNLPCATGNPATSNAISMIVLPVPVSITIDAVPMGAVCAGAFVTFTAHPVNGGPNPTYKWKVNGITSGTNDPTFCYQPVNGDVVTCVLTSNATCASGNTATSNPIAMTVNPLMPVSVTVTANPSGSICNGTLVTYTAIPFNGGSGPSFQWKVNGINAGSNSPIYSFTPVNGDVITCNLTSNIMCATGNPATSNTINMTVNPNLPVSIGITANPSGAICEGTTVAFTGSAINGGSSPVYQWKVNGADVGANSSTYNYAPVNGDIITCMLTSNAICATGNPAVSNPIAPTVNPNLPVSIVITASANPVCEGVPVVFTAAAMNGGSAPVYQWKVNGSNVGSNNPIFSYTPVNGDIITCILTSSATCATGSPATSNAITITMNPNLPVSISIQANPSGAVCAGTSVTFTGTAINGGSAPVYQWKINGIDAGTNNSTFSYIPSNGHMISCLLTSNAICATGSPATSNVIAMNVDPNLPISIGITANPSGVNCEGTVVTFTGTAINGGSSPVFQWKVNGTNVGTNNSTYNYSPENEDIITCTLTSNATCATGNPAISNAIAVNVNPNLPVSIVITASANPVCAGIPVIFTAGAINGGSSPVFQWKVNGTDAGTNNSTYSYIPSSGDVISCILTSNAICATGSPAASNAITMNVNPNLPVSIGITANPPGAICEGTTVTFTGSAINGGTSPVYQWKVNGSNAGTNNSTYNYIPVNGDMITCTLTSNAICATGSPATSNVITTTVSSNLPVSIGITASGNPVCDGIPVMFTAAAINGGPSPVYQWKVNGINVGTNNSTYNYVPVNGDIITCILTSNAICATGSPATSNSIAMTVNPNLPVSIDISVSVNPVCMGNPVIFTGTAINGGPAPVYQWKVNGIDAGTNNSTFSYIPSNGDMISCILTSNAICTTGSPATSNAINMTVNPNLPASIGITANPSGTVCEGTHVIFTGSAINGGSSPVYQWKVNGTDVGADNSTYDYAPVNGDIITCMLTSNAICATGSPAISNPIAPIVNPNLPVSVVITASANPVCEGVPVVFTAAAINGGSAPVYQWKVNGVTVGINSSSYSYTPANGDLITCILTSNATCPTGSPATSNAITITMNPNLPAGISIQANPSGAVCAGTSVAFTGTAINGGSAPGYQWKVNGIDAGTNNPTFNYIPSDGDMVSCILTSNAICATGSPAASNVIAMSVIPNLPVSIDITANPSGAMCEGTTVTFTAFAVNGGTAPVYQWQVNAVNAGSNMAGFIYTPQNGDVITCILTSNEICTSGNPATSNPVTMSVVSAPVVTFSLCFDSVTTINAKPFKLKGGIPLGGTYSGEGVNSSTGMFFPSLAGVGNHQITYSYTNAGVCSASDFVTLVTNNTSPFTCGMPYTDPRDNHVYPTIQVGTQCWFASNLNYGQELNSSFTQRDNCMVEKYCYNNNPSNCLSTGGLYNWDEMMQYGDQEVAQGICPPEWHIPSEDEWNILFNNFTGSAFAGDPLKSGGSSGFNAPLAGGFFKSTSWVFKDFSGFIWSSKLESSMKAWAHGLNANNHGVSFYPSSRSNAFSVRCLKD